jgi:hypothetical protein
MRLFLGTLVYVSRIPKSGRRSLLRRQSNGINVILVYLDKNRSFSVSCFKIIVRDAAPTITRLSWRIDSRLKIVNILLLSIVYYFSPALISHSRLTLPKYSPTFLMCVLFVQFVTFAYTNYSFKFFMECYYRRGFGLMIEFIGLFDIERWLHFTIHCYRHTHTYTNVHSHVFIPVAW